MTYRFTTPTVSNERVRVRVRVRVCKTESLTQENPRIQTLKERVD